PAIDGNYIVTNLYSSNPSGTVNTITVTDIEDTHVLMFNYLVADYNNYPAQPSAGALSIEIKISTDYGTTYTSIETLTNDGTTEGWQEFSYDLTDYDGEVVKVEIVATQVTGDFMLAFDNFYIGIPPTCPTPISLTATNITISSADLSWTSDGSDFDIIWGEEGFDIDDNEGTLEEGFTNGGTLSNLITDTTYEFYVRQDCGATDGVSMWSGPFSFTPQYCTPSYSNPSSSHRITNVSIVETSFSDSPASYADRDRTSVDVPSLNAGEEYTVTATVSGWTSVGVAIDFNQNGSFEEDERVALPEYIALDLVTYTMTIEIPVDISSGNYRMRVWQREANSEAGEDPCGSYDYGTWADYLVPI